MCEVESMDYWRLCEELTVKQAALLITGTDPADAEFVHESSSKDRPVGYDAAVHALHRALKSELIKGELHLIAEYDMNGNERGWIDGTIDLDRSIIEVDSLRDFLTWRGFRSGFFLTIPSTAPDYLDPAHPRYAPKLAAAVGAWQAVTETEGKHPKQALAKWLREHAAEFGLSDDEGKPNETGIDETAKIANWKPGGGAPKTPVG